MDRFDLLYLAACPPARSREKRMPRGPRMDAPGAFHHVMVRGIEGRRIFRDDVDRQDFFDRLSRILPEAEMLCPAWAMMPNHVHLLLRTGRTSLARVMARLNTGYARTFNLRHDRTGYLFQNRYKSLAVADDEYLLGLVRYVHSNPIRADIVPSLDALASYRWTGHAALLGRQPAGFQHVGWVLERFAREPARARSHLVKWMQGAEHEGERSLLDEVDARFGSPTTNRSPREEPAELARIIAEVCRAHGVAPSVLTSGRRARVVSAARAEIAYLACCEFGRTGAEVARALGVSQAAVAKALDRGRRAMKSKFRS